MPYKVSEALFKLSKKCIFYIAGSPEKLLVVIGLLYCCIQVGMEVKRREYTNKQVKKG